MQTQKKKRKKTHIKVPLLGKFFLLLPATCALFYPVWLPHQLKLDTFTIQTSALPKAFDGITIAYISDIHYGPYFSKDRVQNLVERVNALHADFVVLGGDYGRDSQGALDFFNLLPHFIAKQKVYAIMGNHDRTTPESNLEKIKLAMEHVGITPLVNDTDMFTKEGKTLAFCAPDDYYNGFPDIEKLKEQTESADFTVFLPHTPDFFLHMEDYFFDVALCGHTHGGQVTLFGLPLKSSAQSGRKYLSGLKYEKNAHLFTSNGVGTSFLPIRMGAKPQFHLITLKCK